MIERHTFSVQERRYGRSVVFRSIASFYRSIRVIACVGDPVDESHYVVMGYGADL